MIVPMALAPLVAPLLLGLTSPSFLSVSEEARTLDKITENSLFLVLGAVTAIFGTHTINTFRKEEFRARRLNQYHLTKKLGAGGMGEVYLAEHQLLKRPCADQADSPQPVSEAQGAGPVRARGAGDGPAVALEHGRGLRLRPHRGRHFLLCDGIFARA